MRSKYQRSWLGRSVAVLRQFTWGDRLLILAVLGVSVGFIPWLQSGDPGQAAVVHLENNVVATLPLEEETEYSVMGPLGETIIQVKSGKVRVISDPGPQQLCVLQGWISRAGDSLVCLPNQIIIHIPGSPSYDGLIK